MYGTIGLAPPTEAHPACNSDLVLVIDAFCPQGLGFGTSESRQNHRRENGDDRDHYEQLDEGETAGPHYTEAGGSSDAHNLGIRFPLWSGELRHPSSQQVRSRQGLRQISTLFELPGLVEHLLVVRCGDDPFGGVKIERASKYLACNARHISPGKQREEPTDRRKGHHPIVVEPYRNGRGASKPEQR